MSANPNALKEMPSTNSHSTSSISKTSESKSLSNLGKNEQVLVNKLAPADIDDSVVDPVSSNSKEPDEFMTSSESEFGKISSSKPNSQLFPKSEKSEHSTRDANNESRTTSNLISKSNTGSDLAEPSPSNKSVGAEPSTTNKSVGAEPSEMESEQTDLEPDANDEDEKSAAELVAAAAAQIANKTIKKSTPNLSLDNKPTAKTIKATSKLLNSGKQEQVMKKAMLMLNESGKLNVVTDEPMPNIVKLNNPVNKAQIKLRAFRQNFEKQLVEMRRKTPLQIQTLRAELANIEFAEIGNKNIMAGLLELVDDHELKLLTIEKMLKHGDITLSF